MISRQLIWLDVQSGFKTYLTRQQSNIINWTIHSFYKYLFVINLHSLCVSTFSFSKVPQGKMKQLFFQKGQRINFSSDGQQMVQTSSNLDSKKYILVRIPIQHFKKQINYIDQHFYFARQDNLISYFNCWKQTENVPVGKPIIKEKDKRKDKRPMLDVMKRKTRVQTEQVTAPLKKKIIEEAAHQNYSTFQLVYVQMEYFSQIQIPNDFAGLRDLFVVVYLLGKRIQNKLGHMPCLIPVKNEQNDRIKFYKKGASVQIQLYKLMLYLLRDKQEVYLKQWSQFLQKSIRKAMINRDQQLIGGLLKNAIEQQINKPHSISLTNEQLKVCSIETVKIIDYETLKLEESQIELPLAQYKIQYLLKSQTDRQITLTHEVFEQYTLNGKKTNFIVKWLYNMAT